MSTLDYYCAKSAAEFLGISHSAITQAFHRGRITADAHVIYTNDRKVPLFVESTLTEYRGRRNNGKPKSKAGKAMAALRSLAYQGNETAKTALAEIRVTAC